MPSPRIVRSAAAALVAMAALPAIAAEPPHQQGAVVQPGGNVPQNVTLPQLKLDNAQRERVRKVLLNEHNEIEFQLKSTKSKKNFNPTVGAKLPSGLHPHGFPQPILHELPQLRDFSYVKMKDQVVIVDAMTRKIVDVFSETQPQT